MYGGVAYYLPRARMIRDFHGRPPDHWTFEETMIAWQILCLVDERRKAERPE